MSVIVSRHVALCVMKEEQFILYAAADLVFAASYDPFSKTFIIYFKIHFLKLSELVLDHRKCCLGVFL